METFKGSPVVNAKDRKAWRAWLTKNHDKAKGVWLVMPHKAVAKNEPDYIAAVEEALCFGWIDSVKYKYDEHHAAQFYSPRKSRSKWSVTNHERVERMIKEGLMTPAGQAVIDQAKRNGTWDVLVDAQNKVLPDDLQAAFKKNKKALQHFEGFPPSSKRLILEWIASAKRPETRAKRIAETVNLAAKNIRAHHPAR
jgi:uncharacterized protein YdeI (YjbR/CyaY-like superfamily)